RNLIWNLVHEYINCRNYCDVYPSNHYYFSWLCIQSLSFYRAQVIPKILYRSTNGSYYSSINGFLCDGVISWRLRYPWLFDFTLCRRGYSYEYMANERIF